MHSAMYSTTVDSQLPVSSMMYVSHSTITGGTFTQHIQQHIKSGFEYLQDAVAPGAFHNSGARFDPPICHPSTRKEVIRKIMDWIVDRNSDTRDAMIIWLSNAAGAGKSAIVQNIADICYTEGHLVASFFFSRSDPTRNHAESLIATIAYQMYLALLQTRAALTAIVEEYPLLFTRSLSVQFFSLFVKPLHSVSSFHRIKARLIILDGLDECEDRRVQVQILNLICSAIDKHHLPLTFLVASWPEHDISTKFGSPDMAVLLDHLILDESYSPDQDIELYLCDTFREISQTHPFKHLIPTLWPTDDVIACLVHKSSAQFIFASTMLRYVESSRHRPDHRLEIVLDVK